MVPLIIFATFAAVSSPNNGHPHPHPHPHLMSPLDLLTAERAHEHRHLYIPCCFNLLSQRCFGAVCLWLRCAMCGLTQEVVCCVNDHAGHLDLELRTLNRCVALCSSTHTSSPTRRCTNRLSRQHQTINQIS